MPLRVLRVIIIATIPVNLRKTMIYAAVVLSSLISARLSSCMIWISLSASDSAPITDSASITDSTTSASVAVTSALDRLGKGLSDDRNLFGSSSIYSSGTS